MPFPKEYLLGLQPAEWRSDYSEPQLSIQPVKNIRRTYIWYIICAVCGAITLWFIAPA